MVIYLGMVPPEIKSAVRKNELPQHLVCGVDIYRSRGCALEDRVKLDLSIVCGMVRHRHLYLSGRHYRLIDLLDADDHMPFSDISGLRKHLIDRKIGQTNLLKKDILENEDGAVAYVLTPLTKKEFADLMAWKRS